MSESGTGAVPAGLDIPADLLAFDAPTMRTLGYAMVDRTIAHLQGLGDIPAISEGTPDSLEASLGGPLPQSSGDLAEGLGLLAETALAYQQHGDHPRYFARVPGPSSFPGILADWLATGMQSVASSWAGGSGTTTVELTVIRWLAEALGLSPDCEGILQSGGSMANTTAIMAARAQRGPGVVYVSDQTHSSLTRSLRMIEQPADQVRMLPTNTRFALEAATVRAAVEADLAAGMRPMLVIATAGSTNTGAVDELDHLADLAQEFGFWLHVDGAYGGAAALSPLGRAHMRGLERADSFVTDPHKWLFQPYDIACLLVRHPGVLEQAFAMYPEYLRDLAGSQVDLHNRSLELTRRSRALKLWLTFRTYGVEILALAVERGIALAEYAGSVIEADPRLEIVVPPQLGIVNFAHIDATDEHHRAAVARLNADGFAAASTTVLDGRTVLRLCIINPRTTTDDLDGTIARLAEYCGQP